MLVGIGALVGMLRVPGSRSSLVPFEFALRLGVGMLGMRALVGAVLGGSGLLWAMKGWGCWTGAKRDGVEGLDLRVYVVGGAVSPCSCARARLGLGLVCP